MFKKKPQSLTKNHRTNSRFLERVSLSVIIFFIYCLISVDISYAANLSISPSSVITKVGKTFTVDLVVNNNIDAINAASAIVSFPSDSLQVTSISKAGSFITLWAEEPAFSNDKGTVILEGVALNPG